MSSLPSHQPGYGPLLCWVWESPDAGRCPNLRRPATGAVLRNPYRVVCAIGKGGMGALYLVEDMGAFGRLRVIKVKGSLEDGHTWWQVRLPDSIAGWAAEEWLQPARWGLGGSPLPAGR